MQGDVIGTIATAKEGVGNETFFISRIWSMRKSII